MKVPLGWLSEWVDLPDDRDALLERLTVAGLEIEDVIQTGPVLDDIVVGQVLERAQHPNADRLSVCRVDAGGEEPVEVVCGAPNVDGGQKIAFAPVGSRLPDGTKLKKSKLRGVVSRGMICSSRELGLGDDHEGILVLDPEATVGAPLASVVPTGETVVDFEVTPNRGDWASILGMAREVRAHFPGPLRVPPCEPPESGAPAADAVRVAIEDGEGCPRYAGRVVRGVRVGASPEWLRERLEAVGLRSINTVVDVTNLVMLEFGQPLHAFDLARLEGAEVRVRRAQPGERITTLDGEERALEADDVVIADAAHPIAIAGVMGGADSEVTADTRDILLESAWFDPARVRRTRRRLGLHTDASYRFERGVDREGVVRALDRAARLLAELADGTVAPGVVDATGTPPVASERIALDPARANRLLGTELELETVRECLARIDIDSEAAADGTLACRIPSYRNDLHREVDLIEEVARVHGYDRIEPTLPEGQLAPASVPRLRRLEETARNALAAAGLVEVMTIPFLAAADLDAIGLAEDDPRRATVPLVNPIQQEHDRLRSHFLPPLLRVAQHNLSRQVDPVRVFEVARCFRRAAPDANTEGLPEESTEVALLVTRGQDPTLWSGREAPPLFYEARGLAEHMAAALGVPLTFDAEASEPYLHPGASCGLRSGKHRVGAVGELHPAVAARFGIEVDCAFVELALDPLVQQASRPPRYREVSRQPAVRRDLAVLVDREQAAGELLEAMRKTAGDALVRATLFDRYEGQGVPEGRVSLAFRLVYQRPDRSLTDAEVAKMTDRVVQMLSHRFGGELR